MKEEIYWRDKTWILDSYAEQTDTTIYYVDLCPCDDIRNYAKTDFVPKFLSDDTHLFDTEPPVAVIQVATPYGWAIVAKWCNNGSTRLYANNTKVIMEAYEILHGMCDSGDCSVAFGDYIIHATFARKEDMRVFNGKDIFFDMLDLN